MSQLHAAVVDSLTQTNTANVAVAPAMALGSLYQQLAFSTTLAAQNAVYAQQQAFIAHQAVTAECVAMLLKTMDK